MEGNSIRRRIIFLVVALFLLGIAVGVSGAYLGMRYGVFPHPGRPTHQEIIARFSRELKLTPAQETQMVGILDQAHSRFHALDAQVEPQYDAIRQDTRSQIRAILTPDQKARFEDMVKRLDQQRKAEMQR